MSDNISIGSPSLGESSELNDQSMSSFTPQWNAAAPMAEKLFHIEKDFENYSETRQRAYSDSVTPLLQNTALSPIKEESKHLPVKQTWKRWRK